MKTNPETANAVPEQDAAEIYGNVVTSFANLMHRNVERLAGLQRATLDMVSNQTADLTKTVRKSFKVNAESAPAAFLDFAETSFEDWLGVQKDILDLMVEQSAQTVQATKVRSDSASKALGAFGELVQQSAERSVAAQKIVADFAAKQNKTVSEFVRTQAGAAGAPVADLGSAVESGFGKVIDAQKEVLDKATEFSKRHVTHRA